MCISTGQITAVKIQMGGRKQQPLMFHLSSHQEDENRAEGYYRVGYCNYLSVHQRENTFVFFCCF